MALRDAESGGETKHRGHYDDDGIDPCRWSHARVVRWLEKLSSGEIAAALPRDAFYNRLDGRTMTSMGIQHIFEAFTDGTSCQHTCLPWSNGNSNTGCANFTP